MQPEQDPLLSTASREPLRVISRDPGEQEREQRYSGPRPYAEHTGMRQGAGPTAALRVRRGCGTTTGAPPGLRSRQPRGARLPLLVDPGAPRTGPRPCPQQHRVGVPRVPKPGLAASAAPSGCSRWSPTHCSAAGTRTRGPTPLAPAAPPRRPYVTAARRHWPAPPGARGRGGGSGARALPVPLPPPPPPRSPPEQRRRRGRAEPPQRSAGPPSPHPARVSSAAEAEPRGAAWGGGRGAGLAQGKGGGPTRPARHSRAAAPGRGLRPSVLPWSLPSRGARGGAAAAPAPSGPPEPRSRPRSLRAAGRARAGASLAERPPEPSLPAGEAAVLELPCASGSDSGNSCRCPALGLETPLGFW